MYVLKQSTAVTIPIFAHDANGDGVAGLLTGDWSAKRIRKEGGSWGAMTATITSREAGWYDLYVTASHTDTIGLLSLYFTHANCKQVNLQFRIETRLMDNLAWPTTSGRSMDVNADGTVDPNLDNATGTLDKATQTTGFNDLSAAQVNAEVDSAIADAGLTDATIADAVWNEAAAGHTDAGKAGQQLWTDLDAVLEDTGTTLQGELDGIQTDTEDLQTQIGVAGLGLTAVPWNAAWDAEVQSEATDALNAYDPPTRAELTTDKTTITDAIAALNNLSADNIWDEVTEGTTTAREIMRLIASGLGAISAGGGTVTLTFRDLADTKNRITATVDANGNRSEVVLDLS